MALRAPVADRPFPGNRETDDRTHPCQTLWMHHPSSAPASRVWRTGTTGSLGISRTNRAHPFRRKRHDGARYLTVALACCSDWPSRVSRFPVNGTSPKQRLACALVTWKASAESHAYLGAHPAKMDLCPAIQEHQRSTTVHDVHDRPSSSLSARVSVTRTRWTSVGSSRTLRLKIWCPRADLSGQAVRQANELGERSHLESKIEAIQITVIEACLDFPRDGDLVETPGSGRRRRR